MLCDRYIVFKWEENKDKVGNIVSKKYLQSR